MTGGRLTKRPSAPPTRAAVRINRYLSLCGVASRRKAEALILAGNVRVNGKVITALGTTVRPGRDKVFLQDSEIVPVDLPLYLVLNKPKDTITTAHDERGRATVMELVRARHRVFPIGRLDRQTTGVLLFTNDGDFAHRLMHPRYEVLKAYRVACDKTVEREHLIQLAKGIALKEGTTAPAEILVVTGSRGREIGITIHEGWNKQVRRMFETLGYEVKKLDRVAYGPVTKEGLPRGATRPLSAQEVRRLKTMVGMEE